MRTAALLLMLAALAPGAAQARTLGSITFAPCTLTGAGHRSQVVQAECARYEVAENPAAPAGRKVELHLALVPATGAPEPDPVVLLAGGPGQSALEAYPDTAAAFEPINRHRSVLLIDQRGTGGSNPLPCPLPDWTDPAAQTLAAVRQQAADCLAKLSDRADPRFYATSDAVRDLEAVRQAVGAPLFNLVGGSYGTRVALEYLRRHPEGVRTVAIESVVPPELALLQEHAANLEDALTKIFGACRADAACRKRFGDPAATLTQLRQRFAQPRQITIRDPRTHAVRSERLTSDVLAGVLRIYSYESEAAALIPLLIDEAARDRPEALVVQGALMFDRLAESLKHGMELSVLCTEDAPFLKPRPEDAATLMGAQIVQLALAQCAVWPHGDLPADFKQPVVSDKPVLLVSGELDPVTPPRYADQALRTLSHGRHLVFKGQGHTPLARGCGPKLLAQFVAQADARSLDASCLAALGPMPFFTSDEGPEP